MRTLADVKRLCKVGAKLTMIRHDWYPNGPLIGVTREIIFVKKCSIALKTKLAEGKISWLEWRPASETCIGINGFGGILPPNVFGVALNIEQDEWMYYRIEPE